VARRIVLHVGLPKTGTTYLQSVAWANRGALREQGVLLPGFGPRQHLWASCVVREEPRIDRRHPDARHAWRRLVGQAADWPDTVLISHEFFSGASEAQVRRALADLGDAEVHVVVTAREIVGLLTARWQEWVKNGATGPIDAYPPDESHDPADEWGWATLDLADVLRRWGGPLPPERVHLVTLPGSEEPRDALWSRFASVVGFDPAASDTTVSQPNESLGVVEVELLRRVNRDLTGFTRPVDKGQWIRGYLAQQKLVPRGGERFWPSPERVAELRARGERGLAEVAGRGYHVVGSLDALRTPAELPARRSTGSVADDELLAAATATIAAMLTDLRERQRGRTQVRPGLLERARRRLRRG
jgi:hypothetical protein